MLTGFGRACCLERARRACFRQSVCAVCSRQSGVQDDQRDNATRRTTRQLDEQRDNATTRQRDDQRDNATNNATKRQRDEQRDNIGGTAFGPAYPDLCFGVGDASPAEPHGARFAKDEAASSEEPAS